MVLIAMVLEIINRWLTKVMYWNFCGSVRNVKEPVMKRQALWCLELFLSLSDNFSVLGNSTNVLLDLGSNFRVQFAQKVFARVRNICRHSIYITPILHTNINKTITHTHFFYNVINPIRKLQSFPPYYRFPPAKIIHNSFTGYITRDMFEQACSTVVVWQINYNFPK